MIDVSKALIPLSYVILTISSRFTCNVDCSTPFRGVYRKACVPSSLSDLHGCILQSLSRSRQKVTPIDKGPLGPKFRPS